MTLEHRERRRRTPAREQEEYGRDELKFGEFWYDLKNNPYASWAAGLGIGIPASWVSWNIFIHYGFDYYGFDIAMVPVVLVPALPTLALIFRGMRQFKRWGRRDEAPKIGRERELLLAVLDSGGRLTSVEAALHTSISVEEAEDMLSRLAERGHLMVESRDGALFYVLPGRHSERQLGDHATI